MAADEDSKWDEILDQRLSESDSNLSESAVALGRPVGGDERAALLSEGGTAAAVPPGAVARRAFEARRGRSGDDRDAGARRVCINDLADTEKTEVRRFLRRRLRNRRSLPFIGLLILVTIVLLILMAMEINRSADIKEVAPFSTPDRPSEPLRLDPPPPPHIDARP